MKKYIYLLIAPTLLSLASCGNNLPHRKSGQFCNVSFSSEVIKSDCPTFAPMDRDLDIHLDIPYYTFAGSNWAIEPTADVEGVLTNPNIEYTVSVDDIHIYIAGKEYPDAFTFFQENTGYNVLTIRKEYVVNDIQIEIVGRPRKSLYLFGYELGEELDTRRVDYSGDKPAEHKDLIVNFSRNYQNKMKPIKTLSGQYAYPVFEHDAIDVTFTLTKDGYEDPSKQLPLPNDLRFRKNARYTREGTDYERIYSDSYYCTATGENGYRSCTFHIPYKIVNDHGSFRQFGSE